jgi:hypothetical protein
MSNYFSFWNPNDGVYPTLDDKYSNGAYLITSSGVFNNKTYTEGSWLVGIRSSDNKITWAVATSIVNFESEDNKTNHPDAGYYTKVRLDNLGNVVDGQQLEATDLPEHKHTAEQISNLKQELIKVLKTMFDDSTATAVTFKIDDETGIISADVDIDEETIQKNEYGQLISKGRSEIDTSQIETNIETLKKEIESIKSTTLSNTNTLIFDPNSFTDTTDSSTGIRTINLNFDEDTIFINTDGKVSVNPEFAKNLGVSTTVTKTMTLDELKSLDGFNTYVQSLVSKATSIDLSEYIDEETIKINSSGKLCAVAMKVPSHKHLISDITGLEEKLTPAANQTLESADIGDLDKSKGVFDFSTSKIGVALILLNQQLLKSEDKISALEKTIGKAQPAEPTGIDNEEISIETSLKIKCYDLNNNKAQVDCLSGNTYLNIPKVYPYNKGTLQIYINEKLLDSIDLTQVNSVGKITDKLSLNKIYDYYEDLKHYSGWYNCGLFIYNLSSLEENSYNLKVVHTLDSSTTYLSKGLSFNFLKVQTNPTLDFTYSSIKLNKLISGIPSTDNNECILETKVDKAYSSRFIPIIDNISLEYFLNNTTYKKSLTPEAYIEGNILFEDEKIILPEDYEGKLNLTLRETYLNNTKTSNYTLDYFRYDNSNIEKTYRIDWSDKQDTESLSYNNFDSTKDLSETQEFPLIRGLAKNSLIDYSKLGGFDYTQMGYVKDNLRYIEFRVPLDRVYSYIAHLSFNLGKTDLSIDSKTGLLNNFKLILGFENNLNQVLATINGNKEIDFIKESLIVNSRNYPGLDLFNTDSSLRFISLGKNNQLSNIKAILFRIGTLPNCCIDVESIINTLKVGC